MEQISGDRRKSASPPNFPLVDSKGRRVTYDRRSGDDRRKNKRGTDVASKILKILN